MDAWTAVFLVGGLLMLASEFVAPSLVAMFLGAAAVITAGLRGLGVVDSVPLSVLVWAVTSLALLVPFRPLVQRLVPGRSVVRRDTTDVEQDREQMGQVVEVVEDISDEDDNGRIRFQGTTWQARSTAGRFRSGERVQLVYRAESVWVVEAVGGNDATGAGRDLFGTAPDAARPEGEVEAEAEAALGQDAPAPRRR
jgi:membrane protein implicated in regulation of membrane protease activity